MRRLTGPGNVTHAHPHFDLETGHSRIPDQHPVCLDSALPATLRDCSIRSLLLVIHPTHRIRAHNPPPIRCSIPRMPQFGPFLPLDQRKMRSYTSIRRSESDTGPSQRPTVRHQSSLGNAPNAHKHRHGQLYARRKDVCACRKGTGTTRPRATG